MRPLDPCISFEFFLQGVPYIFGSILLENGVKNDSVDRLEEIVLHFQILQLHLIILLSLCICLHRFTCWLNIARLHQPPKFLRSEKIFHQHAPMIIVTIKTRNGWLYKTPFRSHLLCCCKNFKDCSFDLSSPVGAMIPDLLGTLI